MPRHEPARRDGCRGCRVSPRLALAWRLGEAHILKAQYAEGYRSPTFFELYRDENQPPLDFEVNRTVELNYVYRDPTTRFRATVYDARLIDRIGPEMGSFSNRAQTDTQGVELDLEKQLRPGWKWLAATAWVRGFRADETMRIEPDPVATFVARVLAGGAWVIALVLAIRAGTMAREGLRRRPNTSC